MSLASRESYLEGERKERYFAQRRDEESKAEKELHYQRLITENAKLKEALRVASDDIQDWVDNYGENEQSTNILNIIHSLL